MADLLAFRLPAEAIARRVAEAIASVAELRQLPPGRRLEVTVQHTDDCPIHVGEVCTCKPSLAVLPVSVCYHPPWASEPVVAAGSAPADDAWEPV